MRDRQTGAVARLIKIGLCTDWKGEGDELTKVVSTSTAMWTLYWGFSFLTRPSVMYISLILLFSNVIGEVSGCRCRRCVMGRDKSFRFDDRRAT